MHWTHIKSLSHMALFHSVCPFKVCCSRSEGIVKHVCPASVPRWTPRLMKPKSSVFSLSTIDVVAGRALMFYGPKWMRPPLTLSENCAKRWKHLPPWVPEREMNDTYWDSEKTHNKCQTSFRCSCVCVLGWRSALSFETSLRECILAFLRTFAPGVFFPSPFRSTGWDIRNLELNGTNGTVRFAPLYSESEGNSGVLWILLHIF